MKKIIFIGGLIISTNLFSQFNVVVNTSAEFSPKEAILYTLDGSKNIIHSKAVRNGNAWNFNFKKPYSGILKLYFPETNGSVNLISENKDVKINLSTKAKVISDITYLDESNVLMNKIQDLQSKNEQIFPALVQIKELYAPGSPFGIALNKEIARLGEEINIDASKNPFVYYYNSNYKKFVVDNSATSPPNQQQIIEFITKSNDYLETSSLLRPILINYLNAAGNANSAEAIDALLKSVIVETPRGQIILSEMIEIFSAYGMTALKDQYLALGKNLKCTITERLASTIQSNMNVEIGAKFPNNSFTTNVKNTAAKSIYDVKASKKVIMFWSSTCSHCEKDLPVLLESYKVMKEQNIEIIGLSLDTEKLQFEEKVNILPWVNDSELRGWNSSYSETYNVTATPTYFVLDSSNKIIAVPNSITDLFTFLKLK